MAKPCNQPLKVNPFIAERDPHTGKWTVNNRVQETYQSDLNLKLVHQSRLIDSIEVKRHPHTRVLPEEDILRCG